MGHPRVYTKYIPAKGHKVNNLKVELYYSLGGMNYFTYKTEARGYYLSVTPVDRSERPQGFVCESTTLGTGIKMLIKEVKRQSPAAAEEAKNLAASQEQRLIDYVCDAEGIEVIQNG